jgi:hypothetical protein
MDLEASVTEGSDARQDLYNHNDSLQQKTSKDNPRFPMAPVYLLEEAKVQHWSDCTSRQTRPATTQHRLLQAVHRQPWYLTSIPGRPTATGQLDNTLRTTPPTPRCVRAVLRRCELMPKSERRRAHTQHQALDPFTSGCWSYRCKVKLTSRRQQ